MVAVVVAAVDAVAVAVVCFFRCHKSSSIRMVQPLPCRGPHMQCRPRATPRYFDS